MDSDHSLDDSLIDGSNTDLDDAIHDAIESSNDDDDDDDDEYEFDERRSRPRY